MLRARSVRISCTVLLEGGGVLCSCLMFAVQCDGARIRTVEGLASADGELHPLQRTFADEHGLQCGFCTPGFLMLSAGALEQIHSSSMTRNDCGSR